MRVKSINRNTIPVTPLYVSTIQYSLINIECRVTLQCAYVGYKRMVQVQIIYDDDIIDITMVAKQQKQHDHWYNVTQ